MGHGNHSSHGQHLGHIIPPKVSHTILVVLLVLTVVTVAVARIDFGNMNIIVAMLIASVKAGLVIVFFMHGLHENKILWTYILIPFVLVLIMIGGVFTDDPFRAKPLPVQVEKAS
jgi:cytochrome c oxidase subunit 4